MENNNGFHVTSVLREYRMPLKSSAIAKVIAHFIKGQQSHIQDTVEEILRVGVEYGFIKQMGEYYTLFDLSCPLHEQPQECEEFLQNTPEEEKKSFCGSFGKKTVVMFPKDKEDPENSENSEESSSLPF